MGVARGENVEEADGMDDGKNYASTPRVSVDLDAEKYKKLPGFR
jgi:hypothetical protein